MKPVMLFASSLLFVATAALAQSDPNLCVSRSLQLEPSERKAYVESCMAQVSSPANVQNIELQYKTAQCEQNARNYRLLGGVRSNYIAKCTTFNEAVMAANRVSAPTTVTLSPVVEKSIPLNYVSKSSATHHRQSAGRQRDEKPCAKPERETGSKGDERERFIRRARTLAADHSESAAPVQSVRYADDP